MARSVPYKGAMYTWDKPAGQRLDTPKASVKSPASGITLWQPELVLADRKQRVSPPRRLVMPGEPAFRPEAVRAQVDEAQSLLRSFSEARAELQERATRADLRGQSATTDQERVFAAMETYRVKAELDDMLKGTMRKMTALLEGRSVR